MRLSRVLAPFILALAVACSQPVSNGVETAIPIVVNTPTPGEDLLNPALYPALARHPELSRYRLNQAERIGNLTLLNLSPEISLNKEGISAYLDFLNSLDATTHTASLDSQDVKLDINTRSNIHTVASNTLIIVPSPALPTVSNTEPNFTVGKGNQVHIDSIVHVPQDVSVPTSEQIFASHIATQLCRSNLVHGVDSTSIPQDLQAVYSLAGAVAHCGATGLAAGLITTNNTQPYEALHQNYSQRMDRLSTPSVQGVRLKYTPLPLPVFRRIPGATYFYKVQ